MRLECVLGTRVAGQRKILVVDDEPHLREVVRFALERAGFEVSEATNGVDALELAAERNPDLLVLDITMPELDGLEVCTALRSRSAVPIIFLSSRDEELDRILGLELGGDDYLTKPFSPRELVARVRAVLRRQTPAPQEKPAAGQSLARGGLRLDLEGWEATYEDRPVTLTVTEFRLLEALLRAPGKVFSRDALIETAYDGVQVSDRTVDSHIRRIRSKFKKAGADVIETVHGVGYRLGIS